MTRVQRTVWYRGVRVVIRARRGADGLWRYRVKATDRAGDEAAERVAATVAGGALTMALLPVSETVTVGPLRHIEDHR